MALHFLSDLHLDPAQPEISALFIDYLQGPACQADAVYLLGDLFEVWADDDVSSPLYRNEIAAMRALSDAGVPLYFICGNRDFLCGPQFARQAGLSLLDEPVPAHERPDVWLMHGDVLCTDDRAYQRFRRVVRWPWLQWLYRKLPKAAKLAIARKIRGSSQHRTRLKAEDILDVNAQAVDDFFAEHDSCRMLIHGHTHRPADHSVSTGQHRLVLADWSPQAGEFLSLDAQGWRRHRLTASTTDQ